MFWDFCGHTRAGLGSGELIVSKYGFENRQARRAKSHRSGKSELEKRALK